MKFRKAGFTLLEVLIGMSLLGVMMLLLFAGLRTSVQNWNAGEKVIHRVSKATVVQNFLNQKIQASLPLQMDFIEEPEFSFQGEEQQIRFVATMPASVGKQGLQLFTVGIQENILEHNAELFVAIEPFFPSIDELETIEEKIVILKGIDLFRLSYFGQDKESEEEIGWQAEWLERTELPRLVKIEIGLNNGEVWSPMIVAPKISATATDDEASLFGIEDGEFEG